jgi:hypothetical protein
VGLLNLAISAEEGHPPGQHLVQQHPHRIEVRRANQPRSRRRFRRQVLGRAHHLIGNGELGKGPFQRPRRAQIEQAQPSGCQHQVFRLEVGVDIAGAVHGLEGGEQPQAMRSHLVERQRPGLGGEAIGQGRPGDQLQGDIQRGRRELLIEQRRNRRGADRP